MRAMNIKVFRTFMLRKAIKKGFLKALNAETLAIFGGDDGIRTHDLYVANVPLSQLSYIPTCYANLY